MNRETRFIIWNQLEILKSLYPNDVDDLKVKQEIVASGYTSQYENLMPHISELEADAQMQEEVYEILDMFRALNDATQKGWSPSNPERSKFKGFDGNNDDHYQFAGQLIDVQGLYQESAPNKNSHSSATLHFYRRMLAKWKSLGGNHDLSHAEAEAIIAA